MANLSNLWLDSPKVTNEQKSIIKSYSEKELDAYFSNKQLEFGTAGIRTTMGPGTMQLNTFTCANIFHAFAKYILNHCEFFGQAKVVIGHDNRNNSIEFSMLAANILSSYGIVALLLPKNKLIPTPIVSYIVREKKCTAGINITASHNPKQYNGIKMYMSDGSQITTEHEQIAKYFEKSEDVLNIKTEFNNEELGNIEYLHNDIIRKYLSDASKILIDHVGLHHANKKFPVVINTNCGTSSKLIKKFLKKNEFKNIKLYKPCAKIDPNFSNTLDPNPENEKSWVGVFDYADKVGAKICIGIDPDADRMAVCIKKDNKWVMLNGNQTGCIFCYYILTNRIEQFNSHFIVASAVTTGLVDNIANRFNTTVYRTPTGFKWIGRKVTEVINTGASLIAAFEESIGSLLLPINRDKDSFTASLLILEIYAKYQMSGMDLIDILNSEIYPQFGYNYSQTISYVYTGINSKEIINEKMDKVIKYPKTEIASYPVKKILWNTHDDCLEWHLENDSWIKFRRSGTEPKLKAYYSLFGVSNEDVSAKYFKIKSAIDLLLSDGNQTNKNENNVTPTIDATKFKKNTPENINEVVTKKQKEQKQEKVEETKKEKVEVVKEQTIEEKKPKVKADNLDIKKVKPVKVEVPTSESEFRSKRVFNQLVIPLPPLAQILGVDSHKPIPRADATKLIWEYIRKHDLQDKKEKRNIHVDELMHNIIPQDKEVVTMFELPKYTSKFLKTDVKIIEKGDEKSIVEIKGKK